MNNSIRQQIPELMALAHDRSEAGRVALVDKVANVFLAPSRDLTPHEESLIHEFIQELIRNESSPVRHMLVEKFSTDIQVARPVARRIARGPIDIARRVLAENENLQDDDLVTIIKDKGDQHALVIASRQAVSEAVADALVTTGSIKVMQIVAENLGAQISPKAMDLIVKTSRIAAMLQKPILERPELTRDKALELYWWVSRDLRRTALERFSLQNGALQDALGKAIEDKLQTHLFEKDEDEAMIQLSNWIEERVPLSPSLLPQVLRMGHHRLFSVILSLLSGLDLMHVDAVIRSANVKMMAVLCRALNVDKARFVSIFLMARSARNDEHVVHPRELSLALEAFDKLKPADSMDLLKVWKLNPADLLERVQPVVA